VLTTRLVSIEGRVGLTMIWTRLGIATSAFGIADNPAHGVAGRYRT
jgi:hypothetical protein